MFNFEKKINDIIKNNIFEYKDGVMLEEYNRLDCMYIALDELTELFHKTDDRFTKDTIMHAILILIKKITNFKAKIRKEDEQRNEYIHSELISMMDDMFSKQRWEQHDTTVDNINKKDDLENNSDKVIDTAGNHRCHCLNCPYNEMVVDKSSLNPLNKSDSNSDEAISAADDSIENESIKSNEESVNTNIDDYTTTIVLDLKCNKNAFEISHLLNKYIESDIINLLKNDNKK